MSRPRISNVHDAGAMRDQSHGERFASRHRMLGVEAGSRKLGFNVTEVPPGKRAFQYHLHHANEELFLVLAGAATARTPDGDFPLREGDLLWCPAGPDGAHQIINTGGETLRYLAISTTEDPEVIEYPDSGKYGVIAGRPPGRRPWDAVFHAFALEKDRVDYWDGED